MEEKPRKSEAKDLVTLPVSDKVGFEVKSRAGDTGRFFSFDLFIFWLGGGWEGIRALALVQPAHRLSALIEEAYKSVSTPELPLRLQEPLRRPTPETLHGSRHRSRHAPRGSLPRDSTQGAVRPQP